jgi:hypothetical protein
MGHTGYTTCESFDISKEKGRQIRRRAARASADGLAISRMIV